MPARTESGIRPEPKRTQVVQFYLSKEELAAFDAYRAELLGVSRSNFTRIVVMRVVRKKSLWKGE